MANWCECELVVATNDQDWDTAPARIQAFLDVALDEKGDLDFNRIIPDPKNRDEWGTGNAVGTKADRPDPEEGNNVVITFETKWSPPVPVIEAMAWRWPDLRFTLSFWERGMQFQGIRQYSRGELTASFDCPYDGNRGG